MSRQATELGTVADVNGSSVTVRMHQSTASGLSFVQGQAYRVGQIGGFVRIPLGYVDLYGVVSSVGASAVPDRLSTTDEDNRWMVIQLVGDGSAREGFQRGISQHPTVGDVVHLVTENDLRIVYGQSRGAAHVRIGNLSGSDSIPALVDINRVVSRHSLVVGTTGSGKSTTVASLLATLSHETAFPSARIVLVDIHGEYSRALLDRAEVFSVSPTAGQRKLEIPYWALSFEELCAATFGSVDDAKSRAMMVDKVVQMKKSAPHSASFFLSDDQITADTPAPFSIHKLWMDLHVEAYATHAVRSGEVQSDANLAYAEAGGRKLTGNCMAGIAPVFRPVKDVKDDPDKVRHRQSAYAGLAKSIDALGSRIRDTRMDFLLRPGRYMPNESGKTEADLDELLESWLGHSKPITVLDLSGVPSSIQSELVGGLLRLVYDAMFWARNQPEGGRERPILFVLEEAHAYLGGGSATAAVKRIAKEGRKYGVSMMLVTQRPSEIDSTVISQCGTIFALRLTNSTDRSAVSSAASDNLKELMGMLPVLRTGEAIVVGEAVNLPMRAMISQPPLKHRPDSSDPVVAVEVLDEGPLGNSGWNRERVPNRYDLVLRAWRNQEVLLPHEVLSSKE
ncbi:ATPase [Lysobacteraceae bacterium NML93-0399]|nr:ATPase [Xanthomonadaceae bacterium NML93-0399]